MRQPSVTVTQIRRGRRLSGLSRARRQAILIRPLAEADALRTTTSTGGELAGLLQVPFELAAEVIELVEGMHQGVAGRAFTAVGPPSRPVRAVHDALAGFVYSSLRGGAGWLGRASRMAGARLIPSHRQDLSAHPRGAALVGAVNGIVGDRMVAEGNPAAVRMAARLEGRDLMLERGPLAAAYPAPTPAVAIFVHGLCGSESSWIPREDQALSFGSRLRADAGYTPVLVRYNSGRHVSENGRALADLLERLVAAWPAEIAKIALIGHSMGGLVVRSACHYGGLSEHRWVKHVRHVACLGSPHLGAPLEKVANAATCALGLLPETRPFGRFLNRRSVGIKDLRFGSVVDEEWFGQDPDAFLQDNSRPIRQLETSAHHALAATITADPSHPAARILGDMLVRIPSATGGGGRPAFQPDSSHLLTGLNHMQLLQHPAVYARLRAILSD